jgi:hypothetical protein
MNEDFSKELTFFIPRVKERNSARIVSAA